MQEIIGQVGNFLFGSIPTLILFVLLVFAYQLLVQGPLSRVLRERRSRTTGAVEQAAKAISAAESRADEYSSRLRQARAEIFRVREQRLRQWTQERDAALEAARHAAQLRVLEARVALENEAAQSRQTLLGSADQLAEQVVRAIMPATAGGAR